MSISPPAHIFEAKAESEPWPIWQDGPSQDWLLWQLADSAFPAGGFVHSGGLEAAWQHGEIRDRKGLDSFITANLRQAGRSSLPFMTATFRQPAKLIELDDLCESFTPNHVANRASRSQGRSLLSTAQRIFGSSLTQGFERPLAEQPPCCHLAPIFGRITRSLGLDLSTACRLFLFLHLRGLLASAVRLGIIGPLEAQSVQHSLAAYAERVLDCCQNLAIEEIAQVSPLLDLWQGTHDRLYSRLFHT